MSSLQAKAIFVGSSLIVRQKIKHHFRMLENNAHSNSKLQQLYNDFGKEDIVYEILDICDPEFHEEKLKEIVVFLNAEVI